MENDIVLFRYADVLLMKSEAKVRDGRNGDEELNQVRTRVGAPERTATLDNLLAERQLELAWGRLAASGLNSFLDSLPVLTTVVRNFPTKKVGILLSSPFPRKSDK